MGQFNYSKAELAQGLRLQKETGENPETFGQVDGAVSYRPSGDLSKQYATRMAGQSGAFAEAMLKNPEFQQQLSEWNDLFGSTKVGMSFMANPPPSPAQIAEQKQQQAMQMQALKQKGMEQKAQPKMAQNRQPQAKQTLKRPIAGKGQ